MVDASRMVIYMRLMKMATMESIFTIIAGSREITHWAKGDALKKGLI